MEQSDGYKLIRQVGAGLAGQVWVADGPSGRGAMRRFTSPAAPAGEEWLADRAYFLVAGRSALTLKHPRIVPVTEVLDEGEDAWIAMEFVQEETLGTLLQRERLSVDQSNYMLRVMALALDYAHRSGVAHADLKPSNVFVGEKRAVRLTDFAISPRARRNPHGVFDPAWAHAYISPEHFIAPAMIGPKSDLYSLGAIAYHMYTGQMPFLPLPSSFAGAPRSGGDPGPAILRGLLTPASAVEKRLSLEVDAVLAKALSRDPNQRYATCVEFVEALEACVAPPPVVLPVAASAKQSARLMYAGIGSLLVALAVAVALFLAGAKKTAAVAALNKDAVGASGSLNSPLPVNQPAPGNPPPVKVSDRRAGKSSGGTDPGSAIGSDLGSGVAGSRSPALEGPKRVSAADLPKRSEDRKRDPFGDPLNRPVVIRDPVPPPRAGRDPIPLSPIAQLPNPRPAAPDQPAPLPSPEGVPKGFSLALYSDNKVIGPGISFGLRDRLLGEMGAGDLKAFVRVNGPVGKGKLSLQWNIDKTLMDIRTVAPNTWSEYRNEPSPGTYQVILRQDLKTVYEYTFRITP